MKILSITAQKPFSTGSGVYLTELVKSWDRQGHEQAVVAGITHSDKIHFPEKVRFDPVYFDSDILPFHICGMSDDMPYPSTRYSDLTLDMVERFKDTFMQTIARCVDEFDPDIIFCHHLYLLTAFVRESFPTKKVLGFCHGSDLRQINKNPLLRGYIEEQIRALDRVFALNY